MKFLTIDFFAPLFSALNLDLLLNKISFFKVPVRIFAYHRVRELSGETMPYERELISATPAQFEKQLKFLIKHYTLTTFKEIEDRLEKEPGYKPNNMAILTFDDGYDDFYTTVFPLLKKYNVPATVYPSTKYIGAEEPIWFDQLGYILDSLQSKQIEEIAHKIALELPFVKVKKADKHSLFRVARSLPDEDRLSFLELMTTISQRDYGVNVSKITNEMLSWGQICELSSSGIEIGSHTISHPILTMLSHERLKYELEESKAIIEKHTGKKVVSLAYPVGGYDAFSDTVIDAVKDSGYIFSVSYVDGVDEIFQRGMYMLKRIRVEENQTISVFRARTALLPLKRVLKQ